MIVRNVCPSIFSEMVGPTLLKFGGCNGMGTSCQSEMCPVRKWNTRFQSEMSSVRKWKTDYVSDWQHQTSDELTECFWNSSLKVLSHECRIGQRIKNEWGLTHEKRMTLTKEKSNTHKQRKLPNDERPVKASNRHETHFRQISTDAKKWFVRHT